jgi:isopenicillin N synthase-like dioxygenase
VDADAIPVVDIAGALDGSRPGAVARHLDEAFREVGFVQITGHAVDGALLDAVYAGARDLWALPEEAKAALRPPDDHGFYGYGTRHDPDGAVTQEKWEINRFESPADAAAHGVPDRFLDHFGANIWPTRLPHLVAATERCFAATRALGTRLMGIFALALGEDVDHFALACVNDASYFAVNHYPGVSRFPAGDQALFRHTDSGTLTILHQRGDYRGLEITLRSGVRILAPVIEEAFVVNLGELMARWTGDRWIATPHRVVLGEPGQSRTSVATFHTPAVDHAIETVPACVVEGATRYDPITVYEWEPQFLARATL